MSTGEKILMKISMVETIASITLMSCIGVLLSSIMLRCTDKTRIVWAILCTCLVLIGIGEYSALDIKNSANAIIGIAYIWVTFISTGWASLALIPIGLVLIVFYIIIIVMTMSDNWCYSDKCAIRLYTDDDRVKYLENNFLYCGDNCLNIQAMDVIVTKEGIRFQGIQFDRENSGVSVVLNGKEYKVWDRKEVVSSGEEN